MSIQFNLAESTTRPGTEIVEVLVNGQVVATITPGDLGCDIRVISSHIRIHDFQAFPTAEMHSFVFK